jgi:hypothetical protein
VAMNRRIAMVGGSLAAFIAAVVVSGLVITSASRDRTSDNHATPTPTQTNAKVEIERAYLAYWDAYTKALIKLDAAPFDGITMGEALDAARSFVQEQTAKNQPIRVRVEHNYRIALVREDFASVDDTFISHSVRLDGNTKEPIEPDPKTSIRNSYTLRKVEGKWKVAEIIGYEESPSPR